MTSLEFYSAPEIRFLLILCAAIYFLISFVRTNVGLALMAVAMLFSPEIPIGVIGFRALVIRIEDILIMILGLAWLAQRAIQRDPRFFAPSPLNKPFAFIILLSLVASAWGFSKGWVNPLTAVFYILKTVEFFLIFLLVYNYVRTERQVRVFLFFTILTVGLITIYTLFQVPSVKIFSAQRISAPFEGGQPEPATIGGYMAFLLLIVLCIFLYEKHLVAKWFYGVLGSVMLIPFIFTLNRTSYIAFLGGFMVVAMVEKRRALWIALAVVMLSSPLWLPQTVKDRIAFTWIDASNPGRELGVDYSFQERIYAFRKMWVSWRQSPFIGWGVTSFRFPDNQYATTLHEIGLIGLGLWAWVFARLFKLSRWLFHYLEGGVLKGMVLGYRAGLLGLLIHAMGSTNFYVVRIMEPFWFVTGLVVSLYWIKASESAKAGA